MNEQNYDILMYEDDVPTTRHVIKMIIMRMRKRRRIQNTNDHSYHDFNDGDDDEIEDDDAHCP